MLRRTNGEQVTTRHDAHEVNVISVNFIQLGEFGVFLWCIDPGQEVLSGEHLEDFIFEEQLEEDGSGSIGEITGSLVANVSLKKLIKVVDYQNGFNEGSGA